MCSLRAVSLAAIVPNVCAEDLIPRADGEVQIKVERYSIQGNTSQGLIASMNRNGPGDGTGTRYDAITTWSVRQSTKGNKSCLINLLLPEPAQKDSFSPELRREWDDYITAIEDHERHHAEIIERVFIQQKSGSLDQIGSAIKAENQRFDDETNHERKLRTLLTSPLS